MGSNAIFISIHIGFNAGTELNISTYISVEKLNYKLINKAVNESLKWKYIDATLEGNIT